MEWGRGAGKISLPLAVGLIGLMVSFQPTVFTALRQLPGDSGDTRFNQYLLEHSWGWLHHNPVDAKFWRAGFFYPYIGTTAFSDVMVGFAPPYWAARALGLDVDQALGVWYLVAGLLNYLAAFLLLRHGLRCSLLGSTFGAYLMAFAISRMHHMTHPQLLPIYFLLTALLAVCCYFRALAEAEPAEPLKQRLLRRGWIVVFFVCVWAQAYGAFYLVYLFTLSLVVAGLWALALSESRRLLMLSLRRDWLAYLVLIAASVAVLLPLFKHYQLTARMFGMRPWGGVAAGLPRLASWLFVSDTSIFYSWMRRVSPWNRLPYLTEQPVGLGFFTTLVAWLGIWLVRRETKGKLFLLTAASLVLLVTMFPGGHTLWTYLYRWIPGVAALRATCRIGILFVIPAGFGLAVLIDRLRQREWPGLAVRELAVLVAVLCCLEQAGSFQHYKAAAERKYVDLIVKQVDRHADAFVVSTNRPSRAPWNVHLDAMLASSELGIPTVNGYSGNFPGDWAVSFWDPDSSGKRHEVFQKSLQAWIKKYRLTDQRIQWIELRDGYRRF